ncbi:MAG: hypothetical protein SOZ27_00910 [Spirochaetia bacterium]|nr:hypothetical protein [Spirochaetia bacterium]
MWIFLFNTIGLICIYFLLRWKLQRSTAIEKQIDKIRAQFNDLTVDMNDATSRNLDALESRIKEAKKLIRQLDKASAEVKDSVPDEPEVKTHVQQETDTDVKAESGQPSVTAFAPISDSLRQSVLKLAVRGMSSAEIAEILNCQLQEVELVLSFSENRYSRK